MSSISTGRAPRLELALETLGLEGIEYVLRFHPLGVVKELAVRAKLVAKLLSKTGRMQHSKALDAVSQALRFRSWHHFSSHLERATTVGSGDKLSPSWFEALSQAVLLLVEVGDEVTLSVAQRDAYVELGQKLSMNTSVLAQDLLDKVFAPLCAGQSWDEVQARHPLKVRGPLYAFSVIEWDDGKVDGLFSRSPACKQLCAQLDEIWMSIEQPTLTQTQAAREWLEITLESQPEFLDGGLELAWMQHDEESPAALDTVSRLIERAERLVPKRYKGGITWGHLRNRFYHRLLWLKIDLCYRNGRLLEAIKLSRKTLRLNPNDNLGVRYHLPLILLANGEFKAAKRELKRLQGDSCPTAFAVRAFVSFAQGDVRLFRRELVQALLVMPILRAFIFDDPRLFLDVKEGYRLEVPDFETFCDYAWVPYCIVPGLREAATSLLSEPAVLAAENELKDYWAFYKASPRVGGCVRIGTADGWLSMVRSRVEQIG